MRWCAEKLARGGVGDVHNVVGLHGLESVDALGVLVVADDVERVLDLDLVGVDRVGCCHGNRLHHRVRLRHGVGLGHVVVMYILDHLPSDDRLRNRDVVLAVDRLLRAAVL